MNSAQTISSLIRALRPKTRPWITLRARARPLAQRPFVLQPRGLRAPFTTSSTTIPPHADDPSEPSPSTTLPAGDSRHTSSSPPRPQRRPSARARKEPTYQITFTCKPCHTRSSHEMSKQGYYHGTVLITCPQCKNRHVISDHLNVTSARAPSWYHWWRNRADEGSLLMTFHDRFLPTSLSQLRISCEATASWSGEAA